MNALFKDNILSSFIALESQRVTKVNSPLYQLKNEGISKFEHYGFPTPKLEQWKYINLKKFVNNDFKIIHEIDTEVSLNEISRFLFVQEDSYRIVFVNGHYAAWLSKTTHIGYDVCTVEGALRRDEKGTVEKIGSLSGQDSGLLALNLAFTHQGAYINVPDNTEITQPIEILYINTEKGDSFYQPRNLIVLGKNAKATVTEKHRNLSGSAQFTNVVTEMFVGQNAEIDYTKYQNDIEQSSIIDSTYVEAQRDSRPKVTTISFSGKLIRNNLNVFIEDTGVNATLNGLTLLDGKTVVDHHTNVEHRAPYSESHEMYKGIYDGQSKGVFNGRVLVAEGAEKTNGFQQNNNIVLSDTAQVNAKPELEIFNDDVRCSHGCTIGQLDHKAMFYLQARGIPKKEAKALLLYAFASELMEDMSIPEFRRTVQRVIARKLGVNLDFSL